MSVARSIVFHGKGAKDRRTVVLPSALAAAAPRYPMPSTASTPARLESGNGSVVLGVCILSTILSALLLGYAVFRKRKTRLAFKVAVLLLCVGWTWQLGCYLSLFRHGGISAGYFETPEGAWSGRMLVPIPVVLVSVGLLITLGLGVWSSWRAGLRLALLAMIGWWLVAWFVFLLPDIPLALQGYGVFI
jgi:hypothetical protein